MTKSVGGQNEFGVIKSIALKHVSASFKNEAAVSEQWQSLNYHSQPDYEIALTEYGQFIKLIKSVNSEIIFLPENDRTAIDSVYCRDSLVVTNKGLILCNMGKPERKNEPAASAEHLAALGLPILGAIKGDGRLEGGDLLYLNEHTLVVGQGYRTNAEGINQLKALVKETVEEVVVVPLPHYKGPGDVFHLMSIISPLDRDLAAVYSPLMPVPFREYLIQHGITLIEIPENEFESMACNILAIAPRKVIMLEGNNLTQQLLQNAGVEVLTYQGHEISRKGEGGPTCLTRPLYRETML